MYEMEGASSAPQCQPDQSPGRSGHTGHPLGPGTGTKDRFLSLPASRSLPRVVPVSNGECISIASASAAQELSAGYFHSFGYPHYLHR
jgi:hypothetical protein